jgi:predicted TIM-barrel fold metal-dependent hydrolase
MLGFRLVFNAEQKDLLTQGHADWLWPMAAQAGIPIMVLAPGLLDYVDAIAREYPTLRLVIDHMGCGRNVQAPEAFAHLPRLLAMAEHENVAVKASGIMGYSSEAYPFNDIHEPVRRVIGTFGPHRVFWGSDLSRMRCSYRECVTCFTDKMPWLAQNDKELVMGKALCDWIGWRT